jgi:tungstate transport system ATP-binding protein
MVTGIHDRPSGKGEDSRAHGGEPPSAARGALAAVRDLSVRREGRAILEVPALTIFRGETLSVIGPNGAGKSTLVAALALLERPASGELWFDGRRVDWRRDSLAVRRRLAMVFQEPLLFDTSVFENVAAGLRLRGVPPWELQARVMRWLERLGIVHLTDRQARTLSGGEAKRTSLARALVLEPELLLLDEPFSALDAPTRESVLLDVVPLLRQRAITTVLVTHDPAEAFALGDRVAVLLDGRVAQIDTPSELVHRPSSEAVAAFIRPRDPLAALAARPRPTFLSGVAADE